LTENIKIEGNKPSEEKKENSLILDDGVSFFNRIPNVNDRNKIKNNQIVENSNPNKMRDSLEEMLDELKNDKN
jgi:hypothetical protein